MPFFDLSVCFLQGGRASPMGGKNSPENIPPTITEVEPDEHSYLGGGVGRGRMGSNRGAITAVRGGKAGRTRRISEGEKDTAVSGMALMLIIIIIIVMYLFKVGVFSSSTL